MKIKNRFVLRRYIQIGLILLIGQGAFFFCVRKPVNQNQVKQTLPDESLLAGQREIDLEAQIGRYQPFLSAMIFIKDPAQFSDVAYNIGKYQNQLFAVTLKEDLPCESDITVEAARQEKAGANTNNHSLVPEIQKSDSAFQICDSSLDPESALSFFLTTPKAEVKWDIKIENIRVIGKGRVPLLDRLGNVESDRGQSYYVLQITQENLVAGTLKLYGQSAQNHYYHHLISGALMRISRDDYQFDDILEHSNLAFIPVFGSAIKDFSSISFIHGFHIFEQIRLQSTPAFNQIIDAQLALGKLTNQPLDDMLQLNRTAIMQKPTFDLLTGETDQPLIKKQPASQRLAPDEKKAQQFDPAPRSSGCAIL